MCLGSPTENLQGSICDWPQIPPFTQQVFTEGLQRARQTLLGTVTLTDTPRSSTEALTLPAAANGWRLSAASLFGNVLS